MGWETQTDDRQTTDGGEEEEGVERERERERERKRQAS